MYERTRRFHRIWLVVAVVFGGVFLVLATFFYLRWRAVDQWIRQSIVQVLSERFHSDVELEALHISGFPKFRVAGRNLSLRHHGRHDVPPLIHIESFSFSAGTLDLLRPIKHIPEVQVENMVIDIPPREPKNNQSLQNPRGPRFAPRVVVDRITFKNVDIVILPKQTGRAPLNWDIHSLVLEFGGVGQPFSFHGNLTNGKPVGEITTTGKFGPWNAEEPGDSPVSGTYRFTDADLAPFPGIDGILSSTGKYGGVLRELLVQGQTDTPDFSLDRVGRPVPLHTDFSATVDGTNGDTYLHSVNLTLGRSLILCEGSVVREPEKQGHLITIAATVKRGRIEDFLALALNSEKPLMTGPVKIKAKLIIPPGKTSAIDKMKLDGQFGVAGAKWSSPVIREKLESLSRHGEGKPEEQDVGSSVSNLTGNFRLEDGVIHFRRLNFSVQGAAIDLSGTYALRGGALDFSGHLRFQAELSQTITGTNSRLLKAFDPLFKKNDAGSVIPIKITGTREKPTFAIFIFHKTISRQLPGEKNKHSGKPDSY